MTKTKTYATEFQSIKPTTNFDRAVKAAESEADSRGVPVAIYEDGKRCMIVHPVVRNARHDFYNA